MNRVAASEDVNATQSSVEGGSVGGGPAQPFLMSWQQITTPLEAIERALYALADQLSGSVSADGADWSMSAHPRSATADVERLQHQLRQEVIDQTLRLRIAERTDPIRNLVFALAFSRSGLADAPAASTLETEQS